MLRIINILYFSLQKIEQLVFKWIFIGYVLFPPALEQRKLQAKFTGIFPI